MDNITFIGLTYFSGVKQPEREADHSPSPSAEVKNAWSYILILHTSLWYGV